jgi:hypothetical protein
VPKKTSGSPLARKQAPATNPEARERQLIALAVDRAEQQLLDGTASSQVITHFLKLATEKERLEREKLERENELLRAKTEALQAEKTKEELYRNVLTALKKYSGQGDDECED